MAKKKTKTEKQPSFEERLAQLETIVEAVESGELGLEEALKKSEEGDQCYKECDKILKAAEKKVELLSRNADGDLVAEPFEDDAEEEKADDDSDEDDDKDNSNDASLF